METNNKKVFGVYEDAQQAHRAVEELLSMGYRSDEISILSKDKGQMDDIEGIDTSMEGLDSSTEAGLKGGIVTGATIGGVGGLLAGLGALAIPGIGPIIAAGPLAAALTGILAGGAVGGTIGTIGGALIDAGVPEEDARFVDERFDAGDIIVYVEADESRFDDVSKTLNYPNRSVSEPIKGSSDPMNQADPNNYSDSENIQADPNNYSGADLGKSEKLNQVDDLSYTPPTQTDPLRDHPFQDDGLGRSTREKHDTPDYESEDPYVEEDYNEAQQVVNDDPLNPSYPKDEPAPVDERSYSNLMGGAGRVYPVDPTVAKEDSGHESRILDEETNRTHKDKAMYNENHLNQDHKDKDTYDQDHMNPKNHDGPIEDTKEWLDEKAADIKDSFDENKRNSVRSYHKEDEMQTEDSLVDVEYDVKEDPEESADQFDNTDEPKENAQNWGNDKLTDVEYEVNKANDESKNQR